MPSVSNNTHHHTGSNHASSSAAGTWEEKQQQSAISSGIANIPNQVHYLQSKKRLSVNLFLFGEPAVGKTSFMNAILGGRKVFDNHVGIGKVDGPNKTVIRVRRQELDEKGTKTMLTLVDVPGLGYSVRKREGYLQGIEFIKDQLNQAIREECQIRRNRENPPADPRIHACLYFLSPNASRLSNLDLDILTQLCKLTNVILVIPKADTLLRHELQAIKSHIREQIKHAGIELFRSNLSEDKNNSNSQLDIFVCLNGDEMYNGNLGRSYPWGFAKVNQSSGVNELAALLFRVFLPELLERTLDLYENYRAELLLQSGFNPDQCEGPADQLVQLTTKLTGMTLRQPVC